MMNSGRHLIKISASLLALSIPASGLSQPSASSTSQDTPAPMRFPGWGFNPSDLDRSIRPGDDFDAFVNGKWMAETAIPAKYPEYGVNRNLRIEADKAVREIISDAIKARAAAGTAEQKIADVYKSFVDVDAINRAGLEPAKPYLDKIRAARSLDDLAALFAMAGIPSPLAGDVAPDATDPKINIVYMGLGGLGLPTRDNYLVDNPRNLEMRAKYIGMLAFMLGKAGYPDPAAQAKAIYTLERRMAQAEWDPALTRNPELTTRYISKADLVAMSGSFPIERFLADQGFGTQQRFIATRLAPTPEIIKAQGLTEKDLAKIGGGLPEQLAIIRETPIETWKAWTAAQFLAAHAAVLPSDIDDAAFEFNGKVIAGQKVQRPRDERGVVAVNNLLGEAVAKLYVERHFPPSSKAAMLELVGNLRKAMALNLEDLAWMTPATRVAARSKLDAFNVKIGYPEKFETYDSMDIRPGAPLENAIASSRWYLQRGIADLSRPVDRTRWYMTPQTVNAYYASSLNEIVFPAAYLQPPHFNPNADPAVNYGAIGATIGHEIGHGFDDSGAKFDGTGALRDWWTATDKATFRKLGAALVRQYDAICPFDNGKTCINGSLTLGENIGDLGGLAMAYRAYKMSLNGKPAPVLDGLTGDQRFFIGYAQSFRNKWSEELQRLVMESDPHSPDAARVNGVLRNFDPWYEAFGVKPGDKLYLPPEQRVKIW